ncbi:hypothetical protein [Vibrio algarum]|uniref:Uncharacterized protein n=1 Tax=Vibrio algarum TaxID=3020714 RepID=A0ABT4YLL0_9VIBR|nr:hypothetical protein [Vibrio sp. KJ40-1]MDB1122427.1 hypothetical protein [Vibrio sp. KJ40-1]
MLRISYLNGIDYGKYWIAVNSERVKLHHAHVTLHKNLKVQNGNDVIYAQPIFKYIHRVEETVPLYEDRKDKFLAYHDELFEHYGINSSLEQFKSIISIFLGGRKDELAKLSTTLFNFNTNNPNLSHFPYITGNKRNEILSSDFFEKYNNGKELVFYNPVDVKIKWSYDWSVNLFFSVFSIFFMVAVIFIVTTADFRMKLVVLSVISSFICVSVVLGVNYLDQFRYSLTGWILMFVVGLGMTDVYISKKENVHH